MTEVYGTEPFKLHRRGAIDTSVEAAHEVDSGKWERAMHRFICSRGILGGTAKDALAAHPNVPYSTITARFAALKEKNLVFDTGKRRDRSAVLVASEHSEMYVKEVGKIPPQKKTRKELENKIQRLETLASAVVTQLGWVDDVIDEEGHEALTNLENELRGGK